MTQKSKVKSDNRKHPRFILILPLQISTKDFSVETNSKNISTTGVFCDVDRVIPVDTEVDVSMKLSYVLDGHKKQRTVKCNGKVAWIDSSRQEEKGTCRVGIAFDKIEGEDSVVLKQYIQKKNLKEARELKKLYLRLKEMAARLVEVEECHPTAEHFRKVINTAIIELDAAAHILDFEINELKNLE